MAMIEKGAESNMLSRRNGPREPRVKGSGSSMKFTLKTGMLFIGVGLGFVLAVPFADRLDHLIYPILVVGIVFFCGGIGLVSGFLISWYIDKKESK